MPDILRDLIWVAIGGAVGGTARYALSGFIAGRVGEVFPWGTLAVNASGAFAIGVVAAMADRHSFFQGPIPWQVAVVGLLGSYTTVSSFSLQTLALIRDGQSLRAGGNVLASLILCLAGVALGFALATSAIDFGAP